MSQTLHRFAPTATALAAALMLAACGGGDADAPPTPTPPADTTPPTVAITDNVSEATATGNVTFTFTFSESVGTSFAADDVVVTGGAKGTFTMVSTTQATLVVTPTASTAGTIDVSVAAAKFADAANNANTAAANASQAYNTVPVVVETTLVNFDEATAPTFAGFGGAEDATVVADPTNAANKVARVLKAGGAELWAGTTVAICPSNALVTLPFSADNKTMSVRVWSPDANTTVRLKVENAGDTTKSVETEATTAAAASWQTLTFNFANQATGTAALDLANTYNKASIFFAFGKTGAENGGDKVYYMDDLKFVGANFPVACPTPPASVFPVSFDSSAVTYTLTGFGGAEDSAVVVDPTNAANKVARATKSATAELWAGTTISTGANFTLEAIPFTATKTSMTLRVWSPTAGIPVRLKVEDAADGTHSVETEATTTVANGWQTLTFNFANQATGTAALNLGYTYNKASVFFNFGTTGANGGGGTFYFDDLTFVN